MAAAACHTQGRACANPMTTGLRDRLGALLARNRAAAVLGLLVCALALSGAWAQGAEAAYGLSVSTQSSRAGAATLAGQTFQETSVIYVFAAPTGDVKKVSFYLDDPTRSGAPRREENLAEYDFNGTNSNGTAIGYPLSSLASGSHTITAVVLTTGGNTAVVSGTFTVAGSTLRFADEFNGSSLDTTKWTPWYGPGHGGHGLRRPSAISVSNGSLVITSKMVNGEIESGGMSHRADYMYGRYEFRVRTERDPTGTMSGILMTWPQYQWSPEFTENDMYETGPSTRDQFRTFIHYGGSTRSQKAYGHPVDATQWHTIAMDWRRDSLKMYRDGRRVWTLNDKVAIPDVMHHVGIQLDARYTRRLRAPVRMYVDYMRIYE